MNEALKKLYNWAYANMECCDEPEFTFFDNICCAVVKYWKERERLKFIRERCDIPTYDDDIEF